MSTLETNLIQPSTGTTLTVGASGDTIDIPSGATFDVTGATVTGLSAGITMAEQWRLATTLSCSSTNTNVDVTANLEKVDTNSPGTIGSSMSESSGIFTFPSTGIYYVSFGASFQLNGDDRAPAVYIEATTDNSSYDISSERPTHIKQTSSSVTYASAFTDQLFDITDTSNQKVRFRVAFVNSSTQTTGSTTRDFTAMRFIRLADT